MCRKGEMSGISEQSPRGLQMHGPLEEVEAVCGCEHRGVPASLVYRKRQGELEISCIYLGCICKLPVLA